MPGKERYTQQVKVVTIHSEFVLRRRDWKDCVHWLPLNWEFNCGHKLRDQRNKKHKYNKWEVGVPLTSRVLDTYSCILYRWRNYESITIGMLFRVTNTSVSKAKRTQRSRQQDLLQSRWERIQKHLSHSLLIIMRVSSSAWITQGSR